MLFAITRWRLIVSKNKQVVMRLPLHEGEYILGKSSGAELRLLDIDGVLTVSADEVVLEAAGKRHALERGGFRLGDHAFTAERTEVASGQTRSMMHDGATAPVDVEVVDGDGRAYRLGQSALRIGTDEDCDIRLRSGYVSQVHCMLFHKDERVLVRDMSSKNGTYVNDVRVVEAEIVAPASLRVGDVGLEVREVGGGARRSTPYIIGESPAMTAVLRDVQRYAPKRAPVLILGATGTGKELIARALHEESTRSKKAFVAVNCGAVARDALESELFGHAKGFGGAERRAGAFVQAQDGTLFLDEIGDLPIAVQASLLRVIESGAVKPLGEDVARKTDVRIIAATHRNLQESVRRGAFREDLYHRLNALTLALPPLRERGDDVRLLAEHFLKVLGPDGRTLRLSPAALQALAAHPFTGNVRELRNAITRGILEGGRNGVVEAGDLGLETGENLPESAPVAALSHTEREAIIQAIRAAKGSRLAAARALGIARSTLYRKLDEHGISDDEILGTKR